jgi:hypothetical protein
MMVKEAKRTAKVTQIAKIKLNGEEIDNVDSFNYLGSVINRRVEATGSRYKLG